jgi:8-oxo-dGTP pyrophosphatase MutT (NUDIX family)
MAKVPLGRAPMGPGAGSGVGYVEVGRMSRPHRIAAGGLTFQEDAVLLVRYPDGRGGTYLVGPGGGLEDDENVVQAIVRETLEETNLWVRPRRVLIIEDLIFARVKMCKIWMLCEVSAGHIRRTEGAEKEGIIEARWFTRAQLGGEVVFPPTLLEHDWADLRSEDWPVACLSSRIARF